MRRLIVVTLIPVLFLSGCFSKSKKIQKDLDLVCDVYIKISKDISALPMTVQKNSNALQESIATLTVASWGPLLNDVKTQEVKNLLNDIQLADPIRRYELVQEAARVNDAKFECPEFNDPYLKIRSLENDIEFEGETQIDSEVKSIDTPVIESEGDPNETL